MKVKVSQSQIHQQLILFLFGILFRIKTIIIKTVTFRLRPLQTKDAKLFFQLMERNRTRLATYFPKSTSNTKNVYATKRYIKQLVNYTYAKTFYTYLAETPNDKILSVLYIKNIDWTVPKCEIAYFITDEYEGKGITTEAIRQLLKICFDEMQMERVFARIALANGASQRVVIKNNFQLEGTMRNDFKTHTGQLIDVNIYGLLKTDFKR